MSDKSLTTWVAQRYDKALRLTRNKSQQPLTVPVPQPTAAWPLQNIELLARYCTWLQEEDSSRDCIEQIYLPMAGHILGLNLKPHAQLNLTTDLDKAMTYIQAKDLSPAFTDVCLRALHRFRRFLRYERGLLEVAFDESQIDFERHHQGLPEWLIAQLTHYQHIRQANWRPSRLADAIHRFWSGHSRLWRWLYAQDDINQLRDIKRQHIFAYMDERLAAGYAAKSVNQDVRAFQATLRFLQEREVWLPPALLHIPALKEPDPLPRFLTDEAVSRLQHHLEERVRKAKSPVQSRNALLDRAIFYLLWHGGLRLGEVEELRLLDLNTSASSAQVLPPKQLIVRQGKGRKDRAVYLTDKTVAALQAYLARRGQARTDHVFIFRHLALRKGFIHYRLKLAGERTGIKVSAHRLRHTCATQLVNAGCRITTIQALLGHRRLGATMVYARVHDRTVAEDYYAAMTVIERRLTPYCQQEPEQKDAKNGHSQLESSLQHLLTVTDSFETANLDEHHCQLLTELQHGLSALTEQVATL